MVNENLHGSIGGVFDDLYIFRMYWIPIGCRYRLKGVVY